MAYSYLDGTATGSLLSGSSPTSVPVNYVPGYGTTPQVGTAPGAGGLDAIIQAMQPYGENAVYKAVQAFNSGQTYNPTTGQTTPMTVAGQGEAWLSPDQLRAKTNALQTSPADYGSSGSGGGGGGSIGGSAGAAAGGSGLNLAGVSGDAGANGGNPAFTNSATSTNPTLGYQNPGQVGYIGAANGGVPQGQQGVLQMQQANPQAALDQYKSTPGYQLLNAPGAYQQSPGYQYAMDQAMNQVQNNASARGMLESGAVIRDMQKNASGLAQQDYGNWWNRQNQLYGDYQNRLQGLAGGPTGSADAMTAGANAAQANLQTGSNLGSLFGNQGTSGMGGIMNTAAAQAGNMINAGQQQATVNAANQATQLAGATLASNKGLF